MTSYEMRIRDWSSDVCASDLVSTSLDTNGKERTRRERECRSGCKPFAKAISRRHVGKQILFLLRHRRVGHVAARDDRRGARERGFGIGPQPRPRPDAGKIRLARTPGHRIFPAGWQRRSEEHTSELQSLMRTSYAVFCLKKKKRTKP